MGLTDRGTSPVKSRHEEILYNQTGGEEDWRRLSDDAALAVCEEAR
jgi:hypothetical protein